MNKLKGMVFAALFASLTGAVAWFNIPLPFTPVPITLQTLMVLLSGTMLGSVYGGLSMIIYLLLGAIGLPVFAGGSSGVGALLGPTGGYLFSYPIAAFVVGKMLETKKIHTFLRYFSFIIILLFVFLVFLDAAFKLGIMKLWSVSAKGYVPMVLLLTNTQRLILIVVSLVVLLLFFFLLYYAKKSKKFSLQTIFAMFTGTLIIYLLGALQGMLITKLSVNAIFVGWVLPFIVGDTIKLLLAAWIAQRISIKRYLK